MKRYLHAGVLAVLLAALIPAAARADQVPVPPAPAQVAQPVKYATFEGRQIRLDQDWGDARACDVFATTAVCYRSEAEMDHAITPATTDSRAAPPRCSSPLRLYQDVNYQGRVLSFWERGFWQNLYNFNDQLSSFEVGACGVHLAWDYYDPNRPHANPYYPCNTGPFAARSSMFPFGCPGQFVDWNDKVSALYIQ